MSNGFRGDLPGFRWCTLTNRYYSKQGHADHSSGSYYGVEICSGASDDVLGVPVVPNIRNSLPTISKKKRSRASSLDCAICLKSGTCHKSDPRMRFVELPCKHFFHLYCIDKWLAERSGSCPTCRGAVDVALAVAARSAAQTSFSYT